MKISIYNPSSNSNKKKKLGKKKKDEPTDLCFYSRADIHEMRQLSKIEELTNNNYQVEEMERWKLISMSNKLEPILLELDQRSSWKRPEKLIEQRVAGRGRRR